MSDNPENEAETVKNCDSNAATDSLVLQNKVETADANFKEDESSTPVEVSVEDEDACKCNDMTDVDNKAIQDIKDSANLVADDCKPSQPLDSATSAHSMIVNNDENKPITQDNEPKELNLADHPDIKDLKKPIEMKKESEETKIKVEDTEGEDKHLDSQQTRNLFETVGLVLRSNTSQTGSDLQTDEAVPGENVIEQKADQGNLADSTPNISEPVQEGTPSYCEFCGFPAANSDIYRKHMKFHDRTNTTYTCFICGIKYKKRDVVVDHYQNGHDIAEADLKKCQSCKFISSDEANLKEHIRKHFLIRPHACGICHQSFATLYNYQRHMEKHTDVERNGIGYTRPISKRRRGSSVCQGKAINSNKRSRQNSKVEEAAKPSSEESKSSKSKPVKRKSTAESEPEESKPVEPKQEDEIQPKNYFVLPTKTINLVCSFCETTTLSKRELSQHLLSTHGDEIITLKPF